MYAKNQLSMIAWALNTKHYGRYLKDAGEQNTFSYINKNRHFQKMRKILIIFYVLFLCKIRSRKESS